MENDVELQKSERLREFFNNNSNNFITKEWKLEIREEPKNSQRRLRKETEVFNSLLVLIYIQKAINYLNLSTEEIEKLLLTFNEQEILKQLQNHLNLNKNKQKEK